MYVTYSTFLRKVGNFQAVRIFLLLSILLSLLLPLSNYTIEIPWFSSWNTYTAMPIEESSNETQLNNLVVSSIPPAEESTLNFSMVHVHLVWLPACNRLLSIEDIFSNLLFCPLFFIKAQKKKTEN